MTEPTDGLFFRDTPQLRPPYIEPDTIDAVCGEIAELGVEPFMLHAEERIIKENPMLFTSLVDLYSSRDDDRIVAVFGTTLAYHLIDTQRACDLLLPLPTVQPSTQDQFDQDIRTHGIEWVLNVATWDIGENNPGVLVGTGRVTEAVITYEHDSTPAVIAAVHVHELLRREMTAQQA